MLCKHQVKTECNMYILIWLHCLTTSQLLQIIFNSFLQNRAMAFLEANDIQKQALL